MIIIQENKNIYGLEENTDFTEIFDSNLDEMATLRKKRSGLPVNIWVDDSMKYIRGGHGMRIKFQPDKGNRPITQGMVPMTIEDEPRIIGTNKLKISGSEIEKLKMFIKKNKDLLVSLSDMKIDFGDFLNKMKKV